MSHPCLPLEIIDPFLNVSIEKNIKKIEKSREKPDNIYRKLFEDHFKPPNFV